jgi:hypothetical protein
VVAHATVCVGAGDAQGTRAHARGRPCLQTRRHSLPERLGVALRVAVEDVPAAGVAGVARVVGALREGGDQGEQQGRGLWRESLQGGVPPGEALDAGRAFRRRYVAAKMGPPRGRGAPNVPSEPPTGPPPGPRTPWQAPLAMLEHWESVVAPMPERLGAPKERPPEQYFRVVSQAVWSSKGQAAAAAARRGRALAGSAGLGRASTGSAGGRLCRPTYARRAPAPPARAPHPRGVGALDGAAVAAGVTCRAEGVGKQAGVGKQEAGGSLTAAHSHPKHWDYSAASPQQPSAPPAPGGISPQTPTIHDDVVGADRAERAEPRALIAAAAVAVIGLGQAVGGRCGGVRGEGRGAGTRMGGCAWTAGGVGPLLRGRHAGGAAGAHGWCPAAVLHARTHAVKRGPCGRGGRGQAGSSTRGPVSCRAGCSRGSPCTRCRAGPRPECT